MMKGAGATFNIRPALPPVMALHLPTGMFKLPTSLVEVYLFVEWLLLVVALRLWHFPQSRL